MKLFMEILPTQNPHITSLGYSIKIYTNKNPPTPFFKFPLQTSLVSIRRSRNYRVSAHLDRPAGRRKNHLRKKLIEQQVRTINTSLPNLGVFDDDSVRNRDNSSTPNTCLWENQYKPPNPIFTVSKDEVDKFSVRNPTELSLNVKHKIFHANLLSKKMEMLQSSSEVFRDNVACLTRKPGFVGKVGVSVFCVFFMFIALNNFFRKEKEDNSEEMLRRKIKARMVPVKGSVEVIQDSKVPVFKERPQLDKEQLKNSIVKVKALDSTSLGTIQEIGAMAREIDNDPDDVPQGNVTGGLSIQDIGNSSDVPNIKDTVAQGCGSNSIDTEKLPDTKRIISSVKEAREYLHKKDKKQKPESNSLHQIPKKASNDDVFGKRTSISNQSWSNQDVLINNADSKDESSDEKLGIANREKWMEDNFHEFEPVVEKIRDGISLYDSPEKIIPRWKGPPPATTVSQEFLDDYLNQRKALFAETLGNLDLDSQKRNNEKVESKGSKTVIEGSDGSIKPGKKSGKEFWQHTKKWSRGFINSYNAENDPETKAAIKDIGKDLDRWITEKEIQDAADIMDKVPDKGKKFIAEKISKLKREMELFGPQAVVSKYSEYGDEEEIDYYWWLDLPFLLCIEIYIDGDGDERIGFYSLEMASDLELDPKPHHIIAFEDAGDCKNLCYVIQTHMEMLGNGNAFVVPQLPKDTYQEAKASGFNVTVIRKGELKLDVDQTLEEVEERIVEIGSKMYHDKIMKSHNVNVDAVMKGVFGLKKTSKRRRLKRPTK
ncbi:hypothetical protein E3N88_27426 [Mikania micrantha]|uniref:Uncharacterized protein n=1 Tax=Mikania micrantha TaxID=192012 RepID=A0A5N6MZF3_9ASTR|nr:hypothetical protein E3N88_27426 [Mikania micrantha]